MHPTPYPTVNVVIADLHAGIDRILGDRLVGLYLFGSLATGAFDLDHSDIDLLAAVASDLADAEFAALDRLHGSVINSHPVWTERIEVGYVAADRLRRMEPGSRLALISPGEPFHLKESGYDWQFNLNSLLERSLTVFGPPPEHLIGPVPISTLLQVLPEQMREWQTWVTETDYVYHRGYQGYMIITMCRSLFLFHNHRQASKQEALAWAEAQYPEWSPLLHDALRWTRDPESETSDIDTTLQRALAFVTFTTGSILQG